MQLVFTFVRFDACTITSFLDYSERSGSVGGKAIRLVGVRLKTNVRQMSRPPLVPLLCWHHKDQPRQLFTQLKQCIVVVIVKQTRPQTGTGYESKNREVAAVPTNH